MLQPRIGYRAGLDAALLAAAVSLPSGKRGLEAGCGAGAALLSAAARNPEAAFVGLERDQAAASLAERNVAANSLGERVQVRLADIATPFSRLGLPPFDAVFANPPFFDDPGEIRGPLPERRGAYIADQGLQGWTSFLIKAVREGGTLTIIHRADRLADLTALLSSKAGSLQILPIHPFADAPAKRVLVRAVKSGKAPLLLLPPLVLHERGGGKHRPEVDAILRGEAAIIWR